MVAFVIDFIAAIATVAKKIVLAWITGMSAGIRGLVANLIPITENAVVQRTGISAGGFAGIIAFDAVFHPVTIRSIVAWITGMIAGIRSLVATLVAVAVSSIIAAWIPCVL